MAVMHGTRTSVACKRCRERKVKCDLAKPICGTCKARGEDCGGYERKRQIKWMTPSAFDPSPRTRRESLSPALSPRTRARRCSNNVCSSRASPSDDNSSTTSLVSPSSTDTTAECLSTFLTRREPVTLDTFDLSPLPACLLPSPVLEISSTEVTSVAALSSAYEIYLPDVTWRLVGIQEPFWSISQAYEKHFSNSLELLKSGEHPLLQKILSCIVLACWGRRYRRHDLLDEAAGQYAVVLRGLREILTNLDEYGVASKPAPLLAVMQFCVMIEVFGLWNPNAAATHAMGMQQLAASLDLRRSHPVEYHDFMVLSRPLNYLGCMMTRRPSASCCEPHLYSNWFRPQPGQQPMPGQVLIDEASGLPSLQQDVDNLYADHPTNRYSRIAALRQYLERAEQIKQRLERFAARYPRNGEIVASQWVSSGPFQFCYKTGSVDDVQYWLQLAFIRQTLGEVFAEIRTLLVADLGENDAGARALKIGLKKDHDSIVDNIRDALMNIEKCFDWSMGICTVYMSIKGLELGWKRLGRLAVHSEAAARTMHELHDWYTIASAKVDEFGFSSSPTRR